MQPWIIKQLSILVDFLGKALGPDYEVILHDISKKNGTIVAIANGEISGRKIGGPLTNASLKMLASEEYKNTNYLVNYKGESQNGKIIRSSTMFINNSNGKPIGLLCINFDDSRYQELEKRLEETIHPIAFLQNRELHKEKKSPASETFHNDIEQVMDDIYREAMQKCDVSPERMIQEEKLEIVNELRKRGLFKLKGSVKFASRKLFCSQASIYRYLKKLI